MGMYGGGRASGGGGGGGGGGGRKVHVFVVTGWSLFSLHSSSASSSSPGGKEFTGGLSLCYGKEEGCGGGRKGHGRG